MTNQAILGRRTNAVPTPTAYPEAPSCPPGLVAITAENVAGRAERLHELVNRVQRVADRIYGLQPQGIDEAKAQDITGDADRLYVATENLDAAIERLHLQVGRVESL